MLITVFFGYICTIGNYIGINIGKANMQQRILFSILLPQYALSLPHYLTGGNHIMKYYEEYLPAIKDIIKANAFTILKKASKTGYVCPICGSGSGNKGTGITTQDGIYFTCWRGVRLQ